MRRDDAAALARTVVEIDGFDFTIRRLAADEMVALEFIPVEVATGRLTDPVAIEREILGNALAERVNNVLAAAVVLPLVWLGTAASCPEDEVWVGDLGPVRDRLVKAIWNHSKVKGDLAEAGRFPAVAGHGADDLAAVEGGGSAALGPAAEEAPAGSVS